MLIQGARSWRAGQAADRSNGQHSVLPESNGCELTWGLCSVLPAATCFRRCFLLLLQHGVKCFCFCFVCVRLCVFLADLRAKQLGVCLSVCRDSY